MKKLFIATIILGLSASIYGCGSTATESTTDNTTDTAVATADESKSEDDVSSDYYFKDNILLAEDVKIEITEHKVIPAGETGNEYGKKPVIAFWYNTTNLSDKEIDPCTAWIVMFTAIQDNNPNAINELEVGMLPDDQFRDSQLENIKKGGTVANAVAYELDDDVTPVTLKATRGLMGEDLGEQTFEIK